jgi:hypothetical protein
VHERGADFAAGIWVIDPVFMLDAIRERLEAGDESVTREQSYFAGMAPGCRPSVRPPPVTLRKGDRLTGRAVSWRAATLRSCNNGWAVRLKHSAMYADTLRAEQHQRNRHHP